MRIERIEASKHKRGRVLVFLEDGTCLKITEQELLDFRLRSGDQLDNETLERLKESAGVSNTRAVAASLIGRRAMSRRSLEQRLQERGASEAEARYAAEWLEAIGALNDAEYAASLVRHYSGMGYGPGRIKEKLYEKKVPRELWEDALEELPKDGGRVEAFLRSKLRGRRPDEKEKRRLTNTLLHRGFCWGEVKEAWRRLDEALAEDDMTDM